MNRVRRLGRSLSIPGLTMAVLLFVASTRPSLIPRGWVFQATLSAFCTVLGYGVGVLLWWLLKSVGVSARLGARGRRAARLVLAVGGPLAVVVSLVTGVADQRRLAALWGAEYTPPYQYGGVVLVTVALALLLLAAGRGIRALIRRTRGLLERWVPDPFPALVSVALVGALAYLALSGVVSRVVLGSMTEVFEARDSTTRDGVEQPSATERSGSPGSLVAWDELGFEGRNFTAGGPTAEQIEELTGTESIEPVRVFVGLASQDVSLFDVDLTEAAQLAVAELHRTDAWSREVLLVVTPTGTGWVVPQAVAGLELMHSGDTATVAMQYSPNPSWVTLLLDRERSVRSAAALFEAVYEHWSQLPEDDRPRLVVFGESLGAFGSMDAFSGLQDFSARADGALWVGTPRFADLWIDLTSARDAGSPEIHPVLDGGAQVRWGSANGGDQGLFDLPGAWSEPRVVLLQHPSDGVTWWNAELAHSSPDWIDEPPGADVLPMTWLPVVTFLQVSFDMFVAASPAIVEPGFGHLYGDAYADGWAAIAPPAGWTAADTARLREVLQVIALER